MHLQRLTPSVVFSSLLICLSLLAGCSSNSPGSSQTETDAQTMAKNDLSSFGPESIAKIENLTRDNGWAEGENTYRVSYRWDIVTTRDFADLSYQSILKMKKFLLGLSEADRSGYKIQAGLMGWSAQISGASDEIKRIKSIASFPEIKKLIDQDPDFSKDPQLAMTAIFLVGNNQVEYGLVDNATIGTKINRQITLSYRKTEKGWQRI